MFYTYILYSQTADKYYVGSSSNPEDRLKKHRNKSKGFTNQAADWEFVFLKSFEDKSHALSYEREIKSWKSRKKIEKLIAESVKLSD